MTYAFFEPITQSPFNLAPNRILTGPEAEIIRVPPRQGVEGKRGLIFLSFPRAEVAEMIETNVTHHLVLPIKYRISGNIGIEFLR